MYAACRGDMAMAAIMEDEREQSSPSAHQKPPSSAGEEASNPEPSGSRAVDSAAV